MLFKRSPCQTRHWVHSCEACIFMAPCLLSSSTFPLCDLHGMNANRETLTGNIGHSQFSQSVTKRIFRHLTQYGQGRSDSPDHSLGPSLSPAQYVPIIIHHYLLDNTLAQGKAAHQMVYNYKDHLESRKFCIILYFFLLASPLARVGRVMLIGFKHPRPCWPIQAIRYLQSSCRQMLRSTSMPSLLM